MENNGCVSCGKSKANLVCGSCSCHVCKNCAQFLDEGTFSFLAKIPAPLSHQVYCGACFEKDVAAELQNYNDIMERAKNIDIFMREQSKETQFIKRPERKPLQIANCNDREETILRLAFLAAQAGYNGLIEVDVTYEKVRNNSYQTHIWKGSGVPVNIEARRLIKDRSFMNNKTGHY